MPVHCLAYPLDHHSIIPYAPNQLPEYSSNQEHGSVSMEIKGGGVARGERPRLDTSSHHLLPNSLITFTTIPVKLSSASTLPSEMPSLGIVTGLTNCQSAVPQTVWSKDHQADFLRVTITSKRDITPGQVFVGVKEQELTVQVK
jgi:hypothetical protein